jgi:glycosyltransferase involved in cell wall biosynthesis
MYRSLRAVQLVAISAAQRASAPELPWVATVHNAVDVRSYPLGSAKGEDLLFLGRMHPDKGLPTAIEIARRAGRHLIIAAKCSDEAEIRYFEEEIEPLLGDDTPYVGDVDASEKRALLEHAAALVFPIRWEEPFGLVMIEAMACGTPVIASRRGSVPEVVDHGVTGFVCDGVDQMVRAVKDIRSLDPAAIRNVALERFDAQTMTRGYEAAYRSVLRDADRPSSRQPEPVT